MAREDVNVKVSANVAEALQIWRAMEEGPKGMAGQLQQLGQKGRAATQGLTGEFNNLIGKWYTLHTAIQLGTKLINDFMAANRKMREESLDATVRFEQSFNAFQIQAGIPLRSDQSKSASARLWQIGKDRAMPAHDVAAIAGQMVSGGMPVQEVLDSGADELIKMLNATGTARPDLDKAELARATMLWMSSTKQPLTTDSLRKNNIAIANMFKDTNLQLPDLARFSEDAGQTINATGQDPIQMMAMFSALLLTQGAAKASTAYRTLTTKLSAAGATRSGVAGLKAWGLEPEQVDFVGESPVEVFALITKRLQETDKATSNVAMQRVFGAEAGSAASVMFDPKFLPKLKELEAAARNEDTYNKLTFIGERSDLANMRREEITRDQALQGGGIRRRTGELAIENELRAKGYSEMRIQATMKAQQTMLDLGLADPYSEASSIGGATEWALPNSKQPGSRAGRQNINITIKDPNGNALPHETEAGRQNKK